MREGKQDGRRRRVVIVARGEPTFADHRKSARQRPVIQVTLGFAIIFDTG
jgi:hypothetical protein